MTGSSQPDMACVPYRRKGMYWAMTIPFLLLLLVVFIYLWGYSFILSLLFMGAFFAMSYFQAYCCVHQDCPYVGGFCPAVIGIYPANWMAKLFYTDREVQKSERKFQRNANLGIASWVILAFFPVYWLWQAHWGYTLGYLGAHVAYAIVFGLAICPHCAIRSTCPGGHFHIWIQGLRADGT